MRIKSFLLGMLLICSFAAVPVLAQDDGDDDADTPEFTLSDDQAVTVDGDGEDAGVYRDAASIREELEATGVLYIVIRGRFVAAYWRGNVLVIWCRNRPTICARIKVVW